MRFSLSSWSNVFRFLTLLLTLLWSSNLSAQMTIQLPLFELGKETMAGVLLRLGAAEAAYLAGDDSDSGRSLTDPIVLRFRVSVVLPGKNMNADLHTFFLGDILEGYSVTMDGRLPTNEVVSVFGSQYREVRRRLLIDEDELEGSLSECHDPAGSYRLLLYPDLGLEAISGDDPEMVFGFRFHRRILEGVETYEPCPPEAPDDSAY